MALSGRFLVHYAQVSGIEFIFNPWSNNLPDILAVLILAIPGFLAGFLARIGGFWMGFSVGGALIPFPLYHLVADGLPITSESWGLWTISDLLARAVIVGLAGAAGQLLYEKRASNKFMQPTREDARG
jgi:hypothetical protein